MLKRELLAAGIPELPELAFQEGRRRPATLEGGGGGSSSSSATTSIDKRQVVDNGIGITSDSSTVNVNATSTDFGSIQQAVDLAKYNTDQTLAALKASAGATGSALDNVINLAKTSSEGTGKSFEEVIGFAEKALSLTRDNINLQTTSAQQISDAYKTVGDLGTGNRTIATTGLVIAGVVAVAVVLGFKGKH